MAMLASLSGGVSAGRREMRRKWYMLKLWRAGHGLSVAQWHLNNRQINDPLVTGYDHTTHSPGMLGRLRARPEKGK